MASIKVLGTTGSYKYEFMRFQEFEWKQLVFQFNNYSLTPASTQPFVASSAVIYFPSPGFETAPGVDVNTTGLTFTVTPNSVTIPSPPYLAGAVPNNQIVNGILILEGF